MQEQAKATELVYGIDDRPSLKESCFAALQHFLACFVPIMTPPLIICNVLGFDLELTTYLVSMALFASGISTFIQTYKIGPIGAGVLAVQGTSFVFLGPIIGIGVAAAAQGIAPEQYLPVIFGVCFVGSFMEMILSRFLHLLKNIITPLVSGIVVTLIGLSLVKVAIIDIGGGRHLLDHSPDQFATPTHLALAAIVIACIVIANRSSRTFVRMSSILLGLLAGSGVAAFLGHVDTSPLQELSVFALPKPFQFGFFRLDMAALLPMALLFLITSVESIGDLTATSMVSGLSVEGKSYFNRLRGGILGDGFNSAFAAVFNSFPNTTFSQNNGVIQLTGIASRYVGYLVAGMLLVAGIFPVVGGMFSLIPKAVFGGATIIMFGTVAASGIRIMNREPIDRRGLLIIAVAMGLGLGVTFEPRILEQMPQVIQQIFGSAITTGGLTAILLNIILPRSPE